MTQPDSLGSAVLHGRLWGARAREWADLQEVQHKAEYETVFDRLAVRHGTMYCDVGCASGVAAEIAWRRGARVSGLDAADNFIEVARERVPSGDFRVGEMERLPFMSGMFDVVTGFRAFN